MKKMKKMKKKDKKQKKKNLLSKQVREGIIMFARRSKEHLICRPIFQVN